MSIDRVHLDRLRFSCLRYPTLAMRANMTDSHNDQPTRISRYLQAEQFFSLHEMACWQTLMLRTAKDRLSTLDVLLQGPI
jgi:hypothetical protein